MTYFARLFITSLLSFILVLPSIPAPAVALDLQKFRSGLETPVTKTGHRAHRWHRHYYRHPRRYHRHHRRYHRHGRRSRSPWPYIIGGIIIGGVIVNASRHYHWCESRYRSYDRRSNTFQPYHGPRQRCVSPYYR